MAGGKSNEMERLVGSLAGMEGFGIMELEWKDLLVFHPFENWLVRTMTLWNWNNENILKVFHWILN